MNHGWTTRHDEPEALAAAYGRLKGNESVTESELETAIRDWKYSRITKEVLQHTVDAWVGGDVAEVEMQGGIVVVEIEAPPEPDE